MSEALPAEVTFQNVNAAIFDEQKLTSVNDNETNIDPLLETTSTSKRNEQTDDDKKKKKRGRPSSWVKGGAENSTYENLDEDTLKKIRSIGAERQRKRRARETPEEKAERLVKGRISLMKNRLLERLTLSDEQLQQKKAEISEKGRAWRQQKLSTMTEEQRAEHIRNKRLRKKYYAVRVSVLETAEEYAKRKEIERQKSSEALRARRARATPEQIEAARERARRYREAKRKRHEAMREINKLQKAQLRKK